MKLIGLTGHAQVGKDTVAGMLAEYGYQRVAFADGVREALLRLDPNVMPVNTGLVNRPTPLHIVVGACGWEVAKSLPEVRRLLQRMGTEVGREMFGNNVWVDRVRGLLSEKTVISDVRFHNEATFIRDRGLLVHIHRPGFGPVNEHVSDKGLAVMPEDYEIHNESGLHTLKVAVAGLSRYVDEKLTARHWTDATLGRIDEALA